MADHQIAGDGPWHIQHHARSLRTPGALTADGLLLWRPGICTLGDLDDEGAVVRSTRATTRGDAITVTSQGYLPFGAQPAIRHVARYNEGLVRVTSDLTIPRQTTLTGQVEAGSLHLPGTWQAVRTIAPAATGALELSPWQPLERAVVWEPAPLAVLLRHGSGWEIELGLGTDVWRWQQGLQPDQTAGGHMELVPADDGWRLRRIVSHFAERTQPAPRTYRFTWYAAWAQPGAPEPVTLTDVPATWRGPGDLDVAPLDNLGPDHRLVIDLADAAWPDAARRTDDTGAPCFCSHTVLRQFRHLIRQLDACPNRSFAIAFRRLHPGFCTAGAHLDRGRTLAHWDMAAIVDAACWARHTLGPDRRIDLCDPWPTPAAANLFLPGQLGLYD